jgi:integrase
MARKLTTLDTMRLGDGMYHDAGAPGLYLQVRNGGASRVWIWRYSLAGKAHYLGLGSAREGRISLKRARELAAEARRLHAERIDPLARRREQLGEERVEQAKAMTFQQCAQAYIAAHEAGWRSATHREQWSMTLSAYVYPVIGVLPAQAVDTGLVLKVLEPLWTTKPETASRVRGRVESVLDYAKARGFRDGENPARWRGNLDHLLPRRGKVAMVAHHPALPYAEIGAFMADLRRREGTSARCLEFAILTAARSGEVIGARWSEIDIEAKLWTVPPERMKGGKEHRVPLSARAVAIIRKLQDRREGDYVFPGRRTGAPLSNMTLWKLLRAIRPGVTTHGFRATFRTWAAERTNFQREVIEAALAHIVGDATERAYARGDALDKRRKLMDAWSEFCGKPAQVTGKVVSINSALRG